MKKYKLIKEYPGSPKLATELTPKVDKENTDTNNFYWEGSWFNPNDFSEYWEEVLQKDYEILRTCPIVGTIYSVKRLSDGEVFTVGDIIKVRSHGSNKRIDEIEIIENEPSYSDGIWFQYTLGCSHLKNAIKVIEKDYEILSYLKKGSTTCTTTKRRGGENHDEFWNIHSVKRLSDGEVFTVGDLIKIPYKDATRITKFQNPERNEYFIEIPTGFTRLVTIEKAKQPLFLTHDGKNIFEGDKVWYVNKEQHYYSGFIAVSGVTFRSDINAYFLTREGAEDYISKNKVLFTTEDGVSIKRGDTIHTVQSSLDGIDRIMVVNFRPKDYPTLKVFSTRAAAENYIERNKPQLSIEDCFKILQKSFLYGNGFEKEIEKYIRKNNR
jgi:hypothetical protein